MWGPSFTSSLCHLSGRLVTAKKCNICQAFPVAYQLCFASICVSDSFAILAAVCQADVLQHAITTMNVRQPQALCPKCSLHPRQQSLPLAASRHHAFSLLQYRCCTLRWVEYWDNVQSHFVLAHQHCSHTAQHEQADGLQSYAYGAYQSVL